MPHGYKSPASKKQCVAVSFNRLSGQFMMKEYIEHKGLKQEQGTYSHGVLEKESGK